MSCGFWDESLKLNKDQFKGEVVTLERILDELEADNIWRVRLIILHNKARGANVQ
jgi:tryptophanase